MFENTSRTQERTALDDHHRCALEKHLTPTPDIGRARGGSDLVLVSSMGGKSYLIDIRLGTWECADAEYHDPDGGCKHVCRARIALGHVMIDAEILSALDVDPQIRAGVDGPGPQVVTADSAILVAGDEAAILEEDDNDPEAPTDERPDDCQCGDRNNDGRVSISCWPCARSGFDEPAREAAFTGEEGT